MELPELLPVPHFVPRLVLDFVPGPGHRVFRVGATAVFRSGSFDLALMEGHRSPAAAARSRDRHARPRSLFDENTYRGPRRPRERTDDGPPEHVRPQREAAHTQRITKRVCAAARSPSLSPDVAARTPVQPW